MVDTMVDTVDTAEDADDHDVGDGVDDHDFEYLILLLILLILLMILLLILLWILLMMIETYNYVIIASPGTFDGTIILELIRISIFNSAIMNIIINCIFHRKIT
eukprot:TRINITY_DN8448_c0_g1_i2.p1 TRINITY_DN8448_c0_g1~~TRINITY_DN8448_c0_g1_i2.p1  ORF type:complete len:104 (+),score=23.71 TRINITY_DN8448_c0_g1_i2:514-825(+)